MKKAGKKEMRSGKGKGGKFTTAILVIFSTKFLSILLVLVANNRA